MLDHRKNPQQELISGNFAEFYNLRLQLLKSSTAIQKIHSSIHAKDWTTLEMQQAKKKNHKKEIPSQCQINFPKAPQEVSHIGQGF